MGRRSTGAGSTEAVGALTTGVTRMAGVLARTLGPAPRPVLTMRGHGTPEVLEDSATIARRITELPAAQDNAGAMALRSMAAAVRHRHGDGAASAAVLADAMVARSARLVTGGANAVGVRRGIERGIGAATEAITDAARPPSGADELGRLATGATHDPALGEAVAELFDVLGPRAAVIVEECAVPGVDRAYLDGARWWARPGHRELLPVGTTELTVRDPRVLVVDQTVDKVEDARAVLELAVAAGVPLLLVARGIEGAARDTLRRNHASPGSAGSRPLVVAVRMPSRSTRAGDDLADLALLTGADVQAEVLGRPLRRSVLASCGRARQAMLTRAELLVSGADGDSDAIQHRVRELDARAATVEPGDDEWHAVRLRTGRLTNATGVVIVGGHTETERKLATERVAKAQRVLESALADGVVPGGGVSYLASQPRVRAARGDCADADEAAGVEAVAVALEAPFRWIVRNHYTSALPTASGPPTASGSTDAIAVDHVARLGDGWGFDAWEGSYVPMAKAGVLDAAGVTRGALEAAGSLAATLVTTAVVLGPPGAKGR